MKQVIDIAIRWRQELEELKLSQLYYLLGGFELSDDMYIQKITKMIVERIEELEKHEYVCNF